MTSNKTFIFVITIFGLQKYAEEQLKSKSK